MKHMKKRNSLKIIVLAALMALLPLSADAKKKTPTEVWPDGTKMSQWFNDARRIDTDTLGTRYVITDYGVKQDSTIVQTAAIQRVIDMAAQRGGGIVVVPRGTFLSGALFFRPLTHLYIEEDGKLKGSDRIADFPITETRIEGETCKYFAALVNADHCDGFTIAGRGTIDGNGLHYWEEFWIRRKWNPQCTNKDAQRPRLVYISNSRDVTVQDVRLVNSPFWTNHLYRCQRVRYIGCHIFSPTDGVKAPSSDAIDIDACEDMLVDSCYMSVNDDAIAIKGGKGTWADKQSENGGVERVLIENCRFGSVHGCLTLGSESIHDRNIVMRNIRVDKAQRVLWLKMRPDTPQKYEYVTIDNISGATGSFLVVRPWTQFFKPSERADMPLSQCSHITMRNIRMDCDNFFDVALSDKYQLSGFAFENIDATDVRMAFDAKLIEGTVVKNVNIKKRESANGLKTTGDADGLK